MVLEFVRGKRLNSDSGDIAGSVKDDFKKPEVKKLVTLSL
jgi:hypothetical protein